MLITIILNFTLRVDYNPFFIINLKCVLEICEMCMRNETLSGKWVIIINKHTRQYVSISEIRALVV